jgi:thermolysin
MISKPSTRLSLAVLLAAFASGCAIEDAAPPPGAEMAPPPAPAAEEGALPDATAAANAEVTRDPAKASIARSAEAHLRATTGIAGLEVAATKVERDELGYTHVRLRQRHEGVDVWAGEAIVHFAPDGSVFAVTDGLLRGLSVPKSKSAIARVDAHARAVAGYGCAGCLTRKPASARFVYRDAEGRDHLAYVVELHRLEARRAPELPTFVIDAHDGRELARFDRVLNVFATGSSLYRNTVSFTTAYNTTTGKYYLEDLSRNYATLSNQGLGDDRPDPSDFDRVRISDLDNTWSANSQKAPVDVHWGAMKTFDYLARAHGYIGIDGKGGPTTALANDGSRRVMSLVTHYGSSYNNAAWIPSELWCIFGDGDGTDYAPFVSLDVVAHELMHGVTQYVAGLPSSGEGGALNEHFSDVLAAMVQRSVDGEGANAWKMGEDVYTAGDALRDMSDPHKGQTFFTNIDGSADHWSERYVGAWDNGGTHFNSTIASKAFYLLVKGGRHHMGGEMTGIGVLKAEAIWWKAVTAYVTSATDFAGVRTATLNAASELYGASSNEYKAVATAWHLVGIGASGTERVTNGDFESSAGWTLWGATTFVGDGLRHSGHVSLRLGGWNNAIGTATTSLSIPADSLATNLTFWISTTSTETGAFSTTTDKVAIEILDASGNVVQKITALPPIYTGSFFQLGFDLSAYRGQSFKLRFRVTNNADGPSTFYIDDVSVQ